MHCKTRLLPLIIPFLPQLAGCRKVIVSLVAVLRFCHLAKQDAGNPCPHQIMNRPHPPIGFAACLRIPIAQIPASRGLRHMQVWLEKAMAVGSQLMA